MKTFFTKVMINALAIAATAWLLPGITVGGNKVWTVILVAIVFGVVNAVIKPIFDFFSCGLYAVTLGLFTFVINALMLWFTQGIAQAVGLDFRIDTFWTAIIGSILISIVSTGLSLFLRKNPL